MKAECFCTCFSYFYNGNVNTLQKDKTALNCSKNNKECVPCTNCRPAPVITKPSRVQMKRSIEMIQQPTAVNFVFGTF